MNGRCGLLVRALAPARAAITLLVSCSILASCDRDESLAPDAAPGQEAPARTMEMPPIRQKDAPRFVKLLEGHASDPAFEGFEFTSLAVDRSSVSYRFEGHGGHCLLEVGDEAREALASIEWLSLTGGCEEVPEATAARLVEGVASFMRRDDALLSLVDDLESAWLESRPPRPSVELEPRLDASVPEAASPALVATWREPATRALALGLSVLALFFGAATLSLRELRRLESDRTAALVLPIGLPLLLALAALLYPPGAYVHAGEHFLVTGLASAHLAAPWPRVLSALAVGLLVGGLWLWTRRFSGSDSLVTGAMPIVMLSPLAVSLSTVDPVYLLPGLLALLGVLGFSDRPRPARWHHVVGAALPASAFAAVTAGPLLALASLPVVSAAYLFTGSAPLCRAPVGAVTSRRLVWSSVAVCVLWWMLAVIEPVRAAAPRLAESVRPALLLLYTDGIVVGVSYPLFIALVGLGVFGVLRRRAPGAGIAVFSLGLFVAATWSLGCWGARGSGDAFPLVVLASAPLLLLASAGATEIVRSVADSRWLRLTVIGLMGFLLVHYHVLHRMFYE